MKIIVKWEMQLNRRFKADGSLNHQWEERSMRVVESDHPRFRAGTHFDFGFLDVASQEGYIIEVRPN